MENSSEIISANLSRIENHESRLIYDASLVIVVYNYFVGISIILRNINYIETSL